MADWQEGEVRQVWGSARTPYVLKHLGGVYSCSCPAWRNQSRPIERRTCKHLQALRGAAVEAARVGVDAKRSEAEHLITSATSVEPSPVAPPLLLAQSWAPGQDVTDWWLSEKLDGVRAYWDGGQFLSRQGHRFQAPAWFTEGLPDLPLDGELWLGRGQFARTLSIVRRQDQSSHWRAVRYLVFDAPRVSGSFETRQAALASPLVSAGSLYVQALSQRRCRGETDLRSELARITALGGEGLMLRQPGSTYEAGRSATLLKVKQFHDAEARVVAHLPGRGRHAGRVGALAVVLSDGTEFALGSGLSDAERDHPPPVGSLVTFRYQELTERGMPRFPTFVRVRSAESREAARAPRGVGAARSIQSPPSGAGYETSL